MNRQNPTPSVGSPGSGLVNRGIKLGRARDSAAVDQGIKLRGRSLRKQVFYGHLASQILSYVLKLTPRLGMCKDRKRSNADMHMFRWFIGRRAFVPSLVLVCCYPSAVVLHPNWIPWTGSCM